MQSGELVRFIPEPVVDGDLIRAGANFEDQVFINALNLDILCGDAGSEFKDVIGSAIGFLGVDGIRPRADLKYYQVDGSGLRRAISSIAVMSWDTLCIPVRMEANPPNRNSFNATVRRHPITPAPLPR